jgi:hypothetical protein
MNKGGKFGSACAAAFPPSRSSTRRSRIKSDQNSRRLFEQLIKECPNVPEADVVRAFATPNIGTKNVEAATIAAVRRKEYNLKPGGPLAPPPEPERPRRK